MHSHCWWYRKKDQLALLNYPTNISGVDAVDSVSGGEECGIDRVILWALLHPRDSLGPCYIRSSFHNHLHPAEKEKNQDTLLGYLLKAIEVNMLSPFFAILGHFPIAINTLNFGLWSTKLGGTVRDINKMTHKWQQKLQRNGHFFTFGQKTVFSPQKNTKNLLADWYLFGKGLLFYLHNFSRSWLEHG